MAVFTVICKECRAALKSSKPVPAGTVITCPKCGVMFAAAAPKPAVATVGGVEVVDDVEVVEDVEIVDEKPARPAVAKKPTRPRDDDDDDEEEEKRPRKFGGNKRKKASPLAIILVIFGILAGVGVVAGSGFVVWKYVITASGDLVNYAPEDAAVIAGADLGHIMNNTPVGPYIALALNSNPQFGAYKREANVEPMTLFDKAVVGFSEKTQSFAMAISTKSAIDKTKFTKALDLTPLNVAGRDVYQGIPTPGSPKILFPSSKIVSVVRTQMYNQEGELVRSVGRSKHSAAMKAMISKASGAHLWVVLDPKSQGFQSGAKIGMGAATPEEKEALEKVKCVGIWAKIDNSTLELTVQAQAENAAAAQLLAESSKKDQEKNKAAAAMLSMMAPAAVKPVIQELMESTTYGTENDCMTMTTRVKMSTLEPAIKEIAKSAQLMAPPPVGHQGR